MLTAPTDDTTHDPAAGLDDASAASSVVAESCVV